MKQRPNEHFWSEWVAAGLALLHPAAPPPTMDRAVRAAKRAMARAAVSSTGTVAGAASVLDTSNRTVTRALNDFSVAPTRDLAKAMGMYPDTPLNDELFPLIRCHYPATFDANFAHVAIDFFLQTVAPRALDEETKLVIVHDYSAVTSTPVLGVAGALMSRASDILAAGAQTFVLVNIVLNPHMSLVDYWSTAAKLFPIPLKFCTTPTAALSLAETAFVDAGMTVPSLSL